MAATTPAGAGRARSTRSATGPEGLTGSSQNIETIQRLLAALRVQDPDAVAAELHPEIEATGQKGTFKGIDAVVGWAKPTDDGHLRSRIEVDEVRQVGTSHVVIDARKQWWWKEEDELADESPLATLFELRDGSVYRWTNFDSIVDAIEAIPAK